MTVADFDGDGHLDLATANNQTNEVAVLAGDGAGGFGLPATYATGTQPLGIVAGDFDEDGHPDLAVTDYASNTVSVLLNDGHGAFGPRQAFAVRRRSLGFDGGGLQRRSPPRPRGRRLRVRRRVDPAGRRPRAIHRRDERPCGVVSEGGPGGRPERRREGRPHGRGRRRVSVVGVARQRRRHLRPAGGLHGELRRALARGGGRRRGRLTGHRPRDERVRGAAVSQRRTRELHPVGSRRTYSDSSSAASASPTSTATATWI